MLKFISINAFVSNIGREGRIILSWELKNSDNSDYYFTVLRGEHAENLLPISSPFNSSETDVFIDYSPITKDPLKYYYYQIKCEDIKNNEIIYSELITSKGQNDSLSRFLVSENNFKLRYISGSPCAFFKKIHENHLRCSNCWNPLKKQASLSNCSICMGTGFINGYYKPIYCYIDLSTKSSSVNNNTKQDNYNEIIQSLFTDFPRMRRGDFICNILTGFRYRIVDVQDELRGSYPMFQTLTMNNINLNDIEYSIEIPEEIKIQANKENQKRKL